MYAFPNHYQVSTHHDDRHHHHHDDDVDEEEEEEDGDSGSKRARRDSSSSVGSSLSMEMPPLFSNGVVGQTTSHLVNRETDLSLNSLLSRSQVCHSVRYLQWVTLTMYNLSSELLKTHTTSVNMRRAISID